MATLPAAILETALARLARAQTRFDARYPADPGVARRQPVHTVYGGAQHFQADTPRRHGELALRALHEYAPDPRSLADAVGLPAEIAERVHARVVAKLEREPVEDFRIDFEDGYGPHSDAEEDAEAQRAATAAAAGIAAGTMSPFFGLRVKTLSAELARRALRTVDLFVTTLVERAGGLPPGFVVTLAKITDVEHVSVFADLLDALESRLGLAGGALRFEIMVETTQCIIDSDGRSMLPALVQAARGRLAGAHFGTYDYTAACDITALHQHMRHPSCDFAKQVMKVALAGTGVWLSDGSTNVLPLGAGTRAAWRRHADDIRHSLVGGFYQGWDLHPAQLVSRFAAVHGFYLEGLPAIANRVAIAEEPATRKALLGFVVRARSSGAITDEEARAIQEPR